MSRILSLVAAVTCLAGTWVIWPAKSDPVRSRPSASVEGSSGILSALPSTSPSPSSVAVETVRISKNPTLAEDLRTRFPQAGRHLVGRGGASSLSVGFDERYAAGARIACEGVVLRQQLVGAQPVTGLHEEHRAEYRGVQPGIDAILVRQEHRMEEFLRIDPRAAAVLTYEFSLESAAGMFRVRKGEADRLEVTDRDGRSILQSGEIVYWTSGSEAPRSAPTEIAFVGDQRARMEIRIPEEDQQNEILLDPSWAVTGSPAQVHSTLTTLSDGRLLATGGPWGGLGSGIPTSAACESYDASTGDWSFVYPMGSPRQSHAATRLADGRVLVSGGWASSGNSDGGKDLSDCELFDPETGSWSSTGSMRHDRYNHLAVLLQDGTVLAMGGWSYGARGGQLFSCEVFNPSTGRWSETASCPVIPATATRLTDGRVLVTSGPTRLWNGQLTGASACVLFNPSTGSFSAAGSLQVARPLGATASLLPNGMVLVAGGASGGFYNRVFVGSTVCELFDPATNTFSPTGSLLAYRYGHSATVLSSGRVLIAAGFGGTSSLRSCEIYDPVTGSFGAAPSLQGIEGRDHLAAPLPAERALAVSGVRCEEFAP